MMETLVALAHYLGIDGLDVLTMGLGNEPSHIGAEGLSLVGSRPEVRELAKERLQQRVIFVDDAMHGPIPPLHHLSSIRDPQIKDLTK